MDRRRARRHRSHALLEWPEFGLNPQRTNATAAANRDHGRQRGHLRRQQVTLPGTVDSSPIYVHAATVEGATHDVIVVTTTYGKTLAIDADSGRILWTFTPPGYDGFAGSAQITNAAPLADPDHQLRLRRLAERARPQARARRTATRGPRGRLAGEHHARRHAREGRARAQHRRRLPDRHDGRLHRRHTAVSGARRRDRPRKRPHRARSSTRSARTAAA